MLLYGARESRHVSHPVHLNRMEWLVVGWLLLNRRTDDDETFFFFCRFSCMVVLWGESHIGLLLLFLLLMHDAFDFGFLGNGSNRPDMVLVICWQIDLIGS